MNDFYDRHGYGNPLPLAQADRTGPAADRLPARRGWSGGRRNPWTRSGSESTPTPIATASDSTRHEKAADTASGPRSLSSEASSAIRGEEALFAGGAQDAARAVLDLRLWCWG